MSVDGSAVGQDPKALKTIVEWADAANIPVITNIPNITYITDPGIAAIEAKTDAHLINTIKR